MTGQLLDFNTAKKQSEAVKTGIDVDDIRSRLHENPRTFVEWLYSGRAYFTKNQARIGNAIGEQGSSLAIDLTTGLWHDHATSEGGDLISLYRSWRGYSGDAHFALSIKEIAADFLRDPIEIDRPTWAPTPTTQIEQRKAQLGTKPREENLQLGAPVATYTYFDTHGNVIASVVRFEPDGTRASKTFRPWCFKIIDGKPQWRPGAPDLRPLYRLPDIATSPVVVLCEGEGCADALTSVGIPATSAMQGANAPIDKTDWSPLAGKTVIVWPDNDPAGFQYANHAAARLTALGCAVKGVTPPGDKPNKWDAADCVAEGLDAHQIIASAQPISVKPRPRIQLLDIDDIEALPPPSWLIDGILTENGLSVVWGRSGAMKSFVALDIALCVATGSPWHGKQTRHGLVVYIAAEGAHGLGRRAVGWRRTRGRDLPKPSFKLIPHPVALVSDDLNSMVDVILGLESKPVLIIIDTLARTFGSGDENKQADMNAYVNASDRLRDATGANVMIIHHSGVHEDRRERGSNVLRGAADTVIKIARKNHNLDIINEAPEGKQKDAEEFKTVKLTTAKVYFEQNDTEQSTLVLNLRGEDGASEPDEEETSPKIGKIEKQIIDALKQAGEPLGLTRLALMTGAHNKSLTRALDTLNEKELVIRADDGDENRKLWRLV